MTARATVSEQAWQDQVLELARLHGWMAAHFRAARTAGGWRTPVAADGAGFPDLVLVRERLVVVELKSERGRVSDRQQQWLQTLYRAGVETYVWRPSMFDRVVEILARREPQ